MKVHIRHATAIVAALVFGVTACASNTAPSSTASPAADAGFPVTIGSLTLDQRPERIVSLSATATEMLFAIDADAQVVAVDNNSNYPPEAPTTELSAYQPSVEAIANYQPDLVVLSDDINKITEQLGRLGIPAFLAPAASTLDDSYRQITELGALTGNPEAARALVDRMRADIDALIKNVPARTRPLTYYYELDSSYYSVTSKTFVGSLLASVGLVSIADTAGTDGTAYPQLSAEVIVDANPDLIFLADTKCCGQSAATVAKRDGWGGLHAVRTGAVVELDDDIASRWGPRVVDLLRTVTDAVSRVPAN